MSVLEKMAKTLQSKDESVFNTVNQMHKLLGLVGRSGDNGIARQASNFLTWLIFNKDISQSSNQLNEQFRSELLRTNPQIQSIVSKFNMFAQQSKLMGNQEGAFFHERGIFTEEGLVNLANEIIGKNQVLKVTGTDQITAIVPKWLREDIFPAISQEVNRKSEVELIKSGRKYRFANKNMKIDAQAINASFDIERLGLDEDIASVYKVLSSATIKSQNDIKKISLEEVTIEKAYTAFIQFSKKKGLKQKDIKNLFIKYYRTKELRSDPYITAHLNHLVKTYALTGMGTTLSSDLKTVLQGAQYLIIVNNTKKEIQVVPTKRIIQEVFFKNNYTKGIVSEVYLNLTQFNFS